MSDIAIRVNELSKRYLVGRPRERYRSLRDSLMTSLARPFSRPSEAEREAQILWALKDISFEVRHGEVMGIIGRNGAGKSTLLKILSRITEPTSGRATIHGRVGSLLEVGTGFHPELSGRENIYMNGAILGMSRAEITRKFDEIVAFAEVERFVDTPVKRYSSGMYMRLAFAVAANMEPEILVVDEVLAVGDIAFQRKCLGKMTDVAKHGRTVLFVSHNMEAVRKLCQSALLMDDGRILAEGPVSSVIESYLSQSSKSQLTYELPPPTEPVTPGYAITATVEDEQGRSAVSIPVGKPWQVRVRFRICAPLEHFIIGMGIMTPAETSLRTTWTDPRPIAPGEYDVVFYEPTLWLEPGRYTLAIGLSEYERAIYFNIGPAVLDVAPVSDGLNLVRISGCGVILNPMPYDLEPINQTKPLHLDSHDAFGEPKNHAKTDY